ncbi:NACHT domain [Fusarium albosuccineum]|uniref:NACHT domain n=1 Tax=Fusarium albosuccineum TaxID=1237068 RepID=A0A8H4KSZ6_9HYPO|nr:NACHT domain [Fusarium albosuccineum]
MALTLSSNALTIAPKEGDQILQDAVDSFRSVLTDEQRLQLDRIKSLPDTDAVLVFTAELDLQRRNQKGKSIASRLFTVLQSVRDFSAIVDTLVSSNPSIAALVWGSVKLTMLVIVNFTSYYEAFSELFMSLGQVCPRFEQYQALFPNSERVQKALCKFNASIIRCCQYLVVVLKRSWHTQVIHSFWESFQQTFEPYLRELRGYSENVEREIELARTQAEHRNRELERLERDHAASSRSSLGRFIGRTRSDFDKMHQWQLLRDEQLEREKKQKLLDSLSKHDHIKPLKQARQKRYPHTAGWLFQTDEFKRWVNGTTAGFLWCSGKMGSGKTILTQVSNHHILTDKSTPESQVTFFFPRFDEAESLRTETILRCIARQMVNIEDVSGDTMQFLKDIQVDEAVDSQDLARFLLHLLSSTKRPTWIIIDGLDECHKEDRRELIEGLASLASAGSHVKIFVTSRETAPLLIKTAYPGLEQTSMSCSLAQADITGLVNQAVQKCLDDKELLFPIPAVTAVANLIHRFLWVTLQLRELCAQPNNEKVRQAISVRNLPKSLTEIFNRALDRVIAGGNEKITQELLPWIVAAKRPLTLSELEECCFIAILQPYTMKDRYVNGIECIETWFQGLVEVDEETKSVHFVHASVRQFFRGVPARLTFNNFHIQLDKANHHIGEICVTYLNFNDFKTTISRRRQPMPPLAPEDICRKALRNQWSWIKPVSNSRSAAKPKADIEETLASFAQSPEATVQKTIILGHPFLSYAASHWLSHSKGFNDKETKTWSLWKQMLTDGHELSRSPVSDGHHELIDQALVNWGFEVGHSALLHVVATSRELMEQFHESMFEYTIEKGDTALLTAMLQVKKWGSKLTSLCCLSAQKGRLEILKLLVGAGAEINRPKLPENRYDSTPLIEAARMGHARVVQFLLKSGADPNGSTWQFQNALQPAAVLLGLEGPQISKLLIDAGVKVNAEASEATGRTALQEACERGNLETVRILLHAGADVNAPYGQERGGTALQLSIISRDLKIIRLLLDHGADVNAEPARLAGYTALQQTGELGDHGHQVTPCIIAKLLLEEGADVNAKPAERAGCTALQLAAKRGHCQLMKLLMDAGADIHAEPAAVDGYTALHAAAKHGQSDAVDLLLRAGADANDRREKSGRTPAALAREEGHINIAEKLEERENQLKNALGMVEIG